MMNCIKTGFALYVVSINKHTRVDLFFDGYDLYVNKNTYFDGIPRFDIEATCVALEIGGQYDKLIDPTLKQSVIDYVKDMKYKGRAEECFIAMFNDK